MSDLPSAYKTHESTTHARARDPPIPLQLLNYSTATAQFKIFFPPLKREPNKVTAKMSKVSMVVEIVGLVVTTVFLVAKIVLNALAANATLGIVKNTTGEISDKYDTLVSKNFI